MFVGVPHLLLSADAPASGRRPLLPWPTLRGRSRLRGPWPPLPPAHLTNFGAPARPLLPWPTLRPAAPANRGHPLERPQPTHRVIHRLFHTCGKLQACKTCPGQARLLEVDAKLTPDDPSFPIGLQRPRALHIGGFPQGPPSPQVLGISGWITVGNRTGGGGTLHSPRRVSG